MFLLFQQQLYHSIIYANVNLTISRKQLVKEQLNIEIAWCCHFLFLSEFSLTNIHESQDYMGWGRAFF